MKYFKPLQPDPFIKKPEDMTPAKFGHLNHIINQISELQTGIDAVSEVADLPASTDITAVPGSFVDTAAVQAYLDIIVPIIETRLNDIEAKLNSLLTALKS